jgi:hypothetical protein
VDIMSLQGMVWSIPVLSLTIAMVLIGIHANLALRKRVIPIVFRQGRGFQGRHGGVGPAD